jgi:hypothetical protein
VANNKKVVQQLIVLLETLGYEKTQKEVKSIKRGMKEVEHQSKATSTAQNKVKRTQEGVHKTSLAAGKEFSRQAQGLGGLVRAYATVAANVFALSSAFLVLKRAADFDSMMISADSFTKVMGTNVAKLAKDLQAATGYNISFAEALERTNKSLAAGFNPAQFRELGTLVAKISQTFGGSIEANMNKVTQAILRGRTETLATMGIVIDLEQAYVKYATTIGKTREQLTKYEQQQATLNAFLEESQNQVGDVAQDPNPYDKMLAQMQDVSQEIMTTLSKNIFNPLIGFLNESKGVAYALIGVLASIFAKTLTPDAAAYASASKKSIQASIYNMKMLATSRATLAAKNKAYGEKQLMDQRVRDAKVVQSWARREEARLAKTGKVSKYIQTLSNATTEQIIANDGAVKKALATAQGDLTRVINSGGTMKTASASAKHAYATGNAEKLRASLSRAAGGGKNFEASMKGVNLSVDTFAKRASVALNSLKSYSSAMKKHASLARLNTITNMETYGTYEGLKKSYAEAFRGLKVLERQNNNVRASYVYMATAARVAGTTIAAVGKAVNSLIPFVMKWIFIGTLLLSVWDKFKSKTSKNIKEFNEALKGADEKTKEFAKTLANLKALQARALKPTFGNLTKEFTFIANAMSDASTALIDLNSALIKISTIRVGGQSLSLAERELQIKEEQLALTEQMVETGTAGYAALMNSADILDRKTAAFFAMSPAMPQGVDGALEQQKKSNDLENEKNEILQARGVLAEKLAEIYGQVGDNLTFVDELRSLKGLPALKDGIIEVLKTQVTNPAAQAFAESLQAGTSSTLQEMIDDVKNNGGNFNARDITSAIAIINFEIEKGVAKTQALANAMRSFSDITIEVSKFVGKQDNFYLDKAKVSEQADILKQLSNNMATIAQDGGEQSIQAIQASLGEAFANQDDKYLLKFLGLEEANASFDDIQARVENLLGAYRSAAETLTLVPMAQEQLKLEQDLLNLKEKQGGPITLQAKLTGQISQNTKDNLSLEMQIIDAKIKIAEADLLNKNLSEDVRATRQAELDILVAQYNLTRAQHNLINPAQDSLVKNIQLNKELVNLQISGLNTQIATLNSLQKSSLSWENQAKYAKAAAVLQAATSLDQIKAYVLARNEIVANVKAEEGMSELDEQRIANLDRQIELERAKLDELQLQYAMEQRIRDIRAEEASRSSGEGLNPFVASFDSYIKLMELEYFKMIQASQSAAEKWVEVTTKGLDGSIDALVDELTSGNFDFVALREAIKESFRTAIGDMVKDNLKTLSRGIMSGLGGLSPEEAKQKIAAELVAENPLQEAAFNAMQQLDTTRNIILENIQTIVSGIANKQSVSFEDGVIKDPAKSPIQTLEGALSQGVNAQEQGADKITSEQQNSTNTIVANNKQGITALVGAIGNGTSSLINMIMQGVQMLITALLTSSSSSTAASMLSVAGTAATGQSGPIKAATGGLFTKPTNAIIGEGSRNEAVVPLPNNREIPVKMTGGGSNVSIEQNFNFENADASAIPQLRMAANQIKQETLQALLQEINKGGAVAKTTGRRR